MSDDLAETIQNAAKGPQAVSGDAGSVTARSLTELIEADRYLKSQDSITGKKRRGLIITKLRPPGAI